MITSTSVYEVEPLFIPTANKGFNHESATHGSRVMAGRSHICELCTVKIAE